MAQICSLIGRCLICRDNRFLLFPGQNKVHKPGQVRFFCSNEKLLKKWQEKRRSSWVNIPKYKSAKPIFRNHLCKIRSYKGLLKCRNRKRFGLPLFDKTSLNYLINKGLLLTASSHKNGQSATSIKNRSIVGNKSIISSFSFGWT